MLLDLKIRLRSLFRRRTVEQEMEEELAAHLEHQEEKLRSRGLPEEEARRQARMLLGGIEQTKEDCRDARGVRYVENLIQDVCYGMRTLRRSPAFAGAAILSLALGIGANTVIFGVINALLLHPLKVPDAGRIVALNQATSFPNYRDIRARAAAFQGFFAYRIAPMSVQGSGAAERAWGLLVTGNYFGTLGLRPAAGRLIGPDDDRTVGGSPYAVLSYDYWRSRFGGDPAISGSTIRINQHQYTVLGVAPRGFYGVDVFYRSQIWVPMSMQPQIEGWSWLNDHGTFNTWAGGRLKPDVTHETADADLAVIAGQLSQEHRQNEGLRLRVTPPGMAGELIRKPAEAFAAGVMLLAVLVLVAACINLASLLSARASDRQRELSIRLSIGAGRRRIVQQLLTEAMLLSLLGGVLAMLLAVGLLNLLSRWRAHTDLPVQMTVDADWRVLLFSLAAALATGLIFGSLPAWRAFRSDPHTALRGGQAATRGHSRFRDGLLGAQVALCALLLTASLVSVEGLAASLRLPLGFQPSGLAVVSIEPGLAGYSEQAGKTLQQELLKRIAALPGVTAAAYTNSIPLSTAQSSSSFHREDEADPRPKNAIPASYLMVSPGYFGAMGTRFVEGRDFTSSDTQGKAPVAIVNQAFARRVFGASTALHKRFRHGGGKTLLEVVGIVEDGKYVSLVEQQRSAVFFPILQRYDSSTFFIARSTRPEMEVANEMRQVVGGLDAGLPVAGAGGVRQMISLAYLPSYAAVSALGAFGLLAMMLACTGIYGLSSFVVSRRGRELAIRRAVGAQNNQILGCVFHRIGGALVLGGLAGIAAAIALAQVLARVVYGASAANPAVLGGAIAGLTLTAVLSAMGPARRALRMDPMQTLRQD